MVNNSENEIIQKIQNGDARSFKDLFEANKEMVFNICIRFLEDKDEAEDSSQDIFIKVYHSIHKFKFESRFSTWLYRICVNHCLNQLKKKKAMKWLSLDVLWNNFTSEEHDIIDHSDDIVKTIERNESKEIINKAIDSLPTKQKTALILSKFEELSYNEIASIMNCSISSVESSLFRAKQNMAKKLVKYFK
jgi:RNA polymerase sigma-70 factor (ECF subfamily)